MPLPIAQRRCHAGRVDAPPAIGVAWQDTEILHARLLGPVDLRVGGQRLAPLDSARAESLLAYLLLHRDCRGTPYPRSRQMTWLERAAADMLLTMASGAEIPVPSDAELAAKRAKTFSPMVVGHFWR